jgi:hypothetical protein
MVFCRGCFIPAPIKADVSSRNVLAVCHRNVALCNTGYAANRERVFFKTTCVLVYWFCRRRVAYELRSVEPLISRTR